MIRKRVIPVLLLMDSGLVKTVKFKGSTYIGDPVNAVRIFNEKEVDEIIFVDIMAGRQNKEPDYAMLGEIAGECFMPLGYGGGIKTLAQAKRTFDEGVEKVILGAALANSPQLANQIASIYGAQSVVGVVDVKRTFFGRYTVTISSNDEDLRIDPVTYAKRLEQSGVGEIFLNSIDRDGMMQGFDLELIKIVSDAVSVPVIACGGAGNLGHMAPAFQHGASAVAAGSMFVFHGKHRAVLISYPTQQEITNISAARS